MLIITSQLYGVATAGTHVSEKRERERGAKSWGTVGMKGLGGGERHISE